jgi:hypothetical protein
MEPQPPKNRYNGTGAAEKKRKETSETVPFLEGLTRSVKPPLVKFYKIIPYCQIIARPKSAGPSQSAGPSVAEVHGNQTHLPPSSGDTPDLKDKCPR